MLRPPKVAPQATQGHSAPRGRRLAALSLTALGVVYGDIGTSPLYALRQCFHGEFSVPPTPANVLGVLSLVFWSLILVVSIKYLVLILRADNRGEGGVLALTALVRPLGLASAKGGGWLVVVGLFAAALLYGDGMITPAITVLGAMEGLEEAIPALKQAVIPITCTILIGLFMLQQRGTAGIGAWFGPVTLVWFLVIAALGIRQMIERPAVFQAILPWHAVRFFVTNGSAGFLVLGAVFLVATGAEALYADMGHFGRRPIRVAWFALVLPALLCNYFGQGALLIEHPELSEQPFYALAPRPLLVPLLVLATLAAVIASQAVISGAFSLTRQAIQLGFSPRMNIVHTSAEEIGQVYVPEINWILMGSTLALVVGFRTSSDLGAAYGVAVTATMVISTLLLFVLARQVWGWSLRRVLLTVGSFLLIDLAFLGANVPKILHGGWFPLVVAGAIFILMTTWKRGRQLLARRLRARAIPLSEFQLLLATQNIPRVEGKAVFLYSEPDSLPVALLHNLKHNRILHKSITVLTVVTRQVPRVSPEEKLEIEDLGDGLTRIVAYYGFMEQPDVREILALARPRGLDLDPREVSFFLGRERVVSGAQPGMASWRDRLFAFLSRNALGATDYYGIPPDRVVEVGSQVEI